MKPDLAPNPAPPPPCNWPDLFSNPNPVELEIGIGKGSFLVRRAAAYPQRNFFGIEWANEFYKIAVDRLRRRDIANARVIRADARQFILDLCPRDSLLCLHIYHPDPWPKKRHNRRRLIQPAFLETAVACLLPPAHPTLASLPPTPGLPSDQPVGGRLAIQTDHAEYFEQIQRVVAAQPRLQPVEFNDPAWLAGVPEYALRHEDGESPQGGEASPEPHTAAPGPQPSPSTAHRPFGAATNFEIKYRREGRAIYQLALVRVA